MELTAYLIIIGTVMAFAGQQKKQEERLTSAEQAYNVGLEQQAAGDIDAAIAARGRLLVVRFGP